MSGPVARYSAWPAERAQLVKLLRGPGMDAIEIGCHAGHTSRVLAAACRGLGKTLLCIDPWDNRQDGAGDVTYRDFQANVAEYGPTVRVLRGPSDEVILPDDLDLGFVFIDGDHTAPSEDMARYWPLLVPGGVMVLHDYFSTGWLRIAQAVKEFVGPREWHYFEYRPTMSERKQACYSAGGLAWAVK